MAACAILISEIVLAISRFFVIYTLKFHQFSVFQLLQCTEKVPTAETVSYKVTVLTPIPPAPKVSCQRSQLQQLPSLKCNISRQVISLMFQFWVELGGIETFVAEVVRKPGFLTCFNSSLQARCGCSELAESPQYTIMLASTLAGTADSKLELSSRLSEQQMDIPTLRNTCWAAQVGNMREICNICVSVFGRGTFCRLN